MSVHLPVVVASSSPAPGDQFATLSIGHASRQPSGDRTTLMILADFACTSTARVVPSTCKTAHGPHPRKKAPHTVPEPIKRERHNILIHYSIPKEIIFIRGRLLAACTNKSRTGYEGQYPSERLVLVAGRLMIWQYPPPRQFHGIDLWCCQLFG